MLVFFGDKITKDQCLGTPITKETNLKELLGLKAQFCVRFQ